MRAPDILAPGLLDFVARAKDDMAQMMRHRVPQFLLLRKDVGKPFQQLAQLPEVLVRVTGVAMDGVVVVPAHGLGSLTR